MGSLALVVCCLVRTWPELHGKGSFQGMSQTRFGKLVERYLSLWPSVPMYGSNSYAHALIFALTEGEGEVAMHCLQERGLPGPTTTQQPYKTLGL